jgi:catechol 2,3-dioxygenase-like lactoylglutathione lyase family enzyme
MSIGSVVPIIITADIVRAEQFYVDTLGMSILQRTPDEGETTGLGLGDVDTLLRIESGAASPGATVFVMPCDDVIGTWLGLRGRRYHPHVPSFVGEDLICTVPDPDRHTVRLTQSNQTVAMTSEGLLELVRVSWEEFNTALEGVDSNRLVEPGAHGTWSVKDILAHIAWWEKHMLVGIDTSKDKPDPIEFNNVDRTNEMTYQANKDRTVDDVCTEFFETHVQVIDQLGRLSDEDTVGTDRTEWLGDVRLWIYVAYNTFDHYPRHAEKISEWLCVDA